MYYILQHGQDKSTDFNNNHQDSDLKLAIFNSDPPLFCHLFRILVKILFSVIFITINMMKSMIHHHHFQGPVSYLYEWFFLKNFDTEYSN
jgi:hypothetical protein